MIMRNTSTRPRICALRRAPAELSERLGTKVVIENKNGRGKLVIQYSDLDVLDGILNRIQ